MLNTQPSGLSLHDSCALPFCMHAYTCVLCIIILMCTVYALCTMCVRTVGVPVYDLMGESASVPVKEAQSSTSLFGGHLWTGRKRTSQSAYICT